MRTLLRFKAVLIILGFISVFNVSLFAVKNENKPCCNSDSTFTLYQLPSVADDHGDSYVIITKNHKVIAIDGGKVAETDFLRGFLAAMGNHVDAWFVTHPHGDHVAAMSKILENPMGLKVDRIYHSRFTPEQFDPTHDESLLVRFYADLDSLNNAKITDVVDCEPGMQFEIDGVNFKILSKRNPEITKNLVNNSSMAFKFWDGHKSVVNLGDLGVEGGNKLLASKYRADLDCDYLKMPHHGQSCCDENFFKSFNFKACLWPTPSWLWTNTKRGGEPGKGPWTTLDTRRWMKEKGINENYVMADGLQIIR